MMYVFCHSHIDNHDFELELKDLITNTKLLSHG